MCENEWEYLLFDIVYIYIGLSLLAVGGIQGWLECPLVTSLGGFNEVIWYPLQWLHLLHSLACNSLSLNVLLMVLSFIQCGLMWTKGFIWFVNCPFILWSFTCVMTIAMTIIGIWRVSIIQTWLLGFRFSYIQCDVTAPYKAWPCVMFWLAGSGSSSKETLGFLVVFQFLSEPFKLLISSSFSLCFLLFVFSIFTCIFLPCKLDSSPF